MEKSINSHEQTGSDPVCFWQPTRTHRPLMQKKSCSEELFRRLGSEEILLTTRTPPTPRTSQLCCRRRIVSEALFEKSCWRRNVSEDLVLKEELLTSDTPDTPKEAAMRFLSTVANSEASVLNYNVWRLWAKRLAIGKPCKQVATAWKLTATTQRVYRRDQSSDERHWRTAHHYHRRGSGWVL